MAGVTTGPAPALPSDIICADAFGSGHRLWLRCYVLPCFRFFREGEAFAPMPAIGHLLPMMLTSTTGHDLPPLGCRGYGETRLRGSLVTKPGGFVETVVVARDFGGLSDVDRS
jgi:hypothetical protein